MTFACAARSTTPSTAPRVSASYGRDLSQPTCQLRPPDTVGFRRYCPYTAAAGRTGEWKAPDLGRARSLVSASGTRGMRVTVWTYPGFWEQAAAAMVRTLDDLGYRASIRRTKNIQMLATRATDEKTRGLQAGMIGWYGLPRAAASLLTGLKCRARPIELLLRSENRRADRACGRARLNESGRRSAAVAENRARRRRSCPLGPAFHARAAPSSSPSAWATTSTTRSGGRCSTSSGCDSRAAYLF